MHRSGTSLVTSLLQSYQVAVPGDLIGPAPDNTAGFWEDRQFVRINEEVLSALGCSWDTLTGLDPWSDQWLSKKLDPARASARAFLENRASESARWGVKDPRLCRLLGFWKPLFETYDIEPHYLLVVRDPKQVAGSLAKRNGISNVKSYYLWWLHTLEAFVHTDTHPRICIDYDDLIEDPLRYANALEWFFEGRDNAFDVRSIVRRELRHNTAYDPAERVSAANDLYSQVKLHRTYDGSMDSNFGSTARHIYDAFRGDESTTQLLRVLGQTEFDLRQQLHDSEQARIESRNRFDAEAHRIKIQLELAREQAQHAIADTQKAKDGLLVYTNEIRELKAEIDFEKSRSETLEKAQQKLQSTNHELEKQLGSNKILLEQAEENSERTKQEFERESTRLWAIIEKYRIENEEYELELRQLTNSRFWGAYRLLFQKRSIRRYPSMHLRNSAGRVARWIYHRIPSSKLRLWLRSLFVSFRAAIRGELDSASQRASHAEIISERQGNSSEKRLLGNDSLPTILISVVTHNSEKWIAPFAGSLIAQDYPLDKIKLHFVDNASTDATVDKISDVFGANLPNFASFQITLSENEGFGAGHNIAITNDDSDFVVVTNVDLEFSSDCLRTLVSFAVQDENDSASWEVRQLPYEHPKFYDPVSLNTSWSSHACVALRRSAYEEVGGYEPRIFMYGEDVELSYRFRAHGYNLKYTPRATVTHHTYAEAGEAKPLQFQGSTLANAYIRLRFGSLSNQLAIVPMYAALWAAKVGVPNARRMVWNNVRKILRNTCYFVRTRQISARTFNFRRWDYELVRDGAFHANRGVIKAGPLVSIITRTYQGRENLLRECVVSILNQTYPNIELIVVEDGGPSIARFIENLQDAYPSQCIHYVPTENRGRCHAGNVGLEAASGEFIMFLDDDDLLFCDHVETTIHELMEHPELGAVYCLAWDVETKYQANGAYEEISHSTHQGFRQPFDRHRLQQHNLMPIQSVVFRKELYLKHGGLDVELDNLEDWNLWVRYSSHAEFKLIEKTTSMYRTPSDVKEKTKRQSVLDAYYQTALEKNNQALALARKRGAET